jgi:hypothetical protein
MTPFLFAAALVLSPGAQSNPAIDGAVHMNAPLGAPSVRTFILPPKVDTCAKLDTQTVAPDGVPLLKRLDKLPMGMLEHAVWRTVGGCPVREVVIGGQTMYLASPSPKIVRLDPAAYGRIDQR